VDVFWDKVYIFISGIKPIDNRHTHTDTQTQIVAIKSKHVLAVVWQQDNDNSVVECTAQNDYYVATCKT